MISNDVFQTLRHESAVREEVRVEAAEAVPEEATAGLEDVMDKLQREIDGLDAEAELA
jgi:hypothetical protein